MAMTDVGLAAQIKSIELQLAVVKARFERSGGTQTGVTCLGDLYGILAGTGSSSEEDIDRVLYTFADESPSAKGNPE